MIIKAQIYLNCNNKSRENKIIKIILIISYTKIIQDKSIIHTTNKVHNSNRFNNNPINNSITCSQMCNKDKVRQKNRKFSFPTNFKGSNLRTLIKIETRTINISSSSSSSSSFNNNLNNKISNSCSFNNNINNKISNSCSCNISQINFCKVSMKKNRIANCKNQTLIKI